MKDQRLERATKRPGSSRMRKLNVSSIVAIGVALLGPASATGMHTIQTGNSNGPRPVHGHGHKDSRSHHSGNNTPVTPLESLDMSSPQYVMVIARGSTAAHNHSRIGHGLQIGDGNEYHDHASVSYALGGRYATLSGTLYGDDAQDTTGAVFTINDGSDPNTTRPLYYWKEPYDRDSTHFTLDVRGVQEISLANSTYHQIDLVADLVVCRNGCVHPHSALTPLESLDMSSPQYVAIIPKGNLASSNRTPIQRGLQIGDGNEYHDHASVSYALSSRYATLSGTFYGDDAQDTSGATFTVNDVSDPSRTRPLYYWKEPYDRDSTHFTLDVRGVQEISLANSAYHAVDVIADLAPCPGGHTCNASTRKPLPLESLDMSSPQAVAIIPKGNLASSNRTLIQRGLQIGDGNEYHTPASVSYALGGHYATLSGTLYGDDAQDTTGAIFTINDVSDPNSPRQLYKVTLSTDRSTTSFSIRLHGAQSINLANSTYHPLDVVANLSR